MNTDDDLDTIDKDSAVAMELQLPTTEKKVGHRPFSNFNARGDD